MRSQWKIELAQAHTSADQVFGALGWPTPADIDTVARNFAVRIPRDYLALVDPSDPNDPIALQCVPAMQELLAHPTDLNDAVGDVQRSPVPGVVQKHSNRVILLVSNTCSMYCRFCFRRPVAPGNALRGLRDALASAFAYLEATPTINEVILSGGDPLTLDDQQLKNVLERLHMIPHIRLIRIHSRAPVTLPSRITSHLCRLLAKHRPLYVVTHFNHPRELTQKAKLGLDALASAGISLLNQSVLLRNINDRVEVLAELSWKLLEAGVTPYYLHHCDRTPGTGSFRTTIEDGLTLISTLRQRVPGHGLPRYVIDIPGGYGKISLDSSSVRRIKEQEWELRTDFGEWVLYREWTSQWV